MGVGKTLKLKRYLQDPGCCAVASIASVGHYYDKSIDYDYVRSQLDPDGDGMYTPDIARFLNKLGFKKVTVVSADINQLDFKWAELDKSGMVTELKKASRKHDDVGYREQAESYAEFVSDSEYDNELVIDRHFGKHIRKHISRGIPVLASYNWNLFFEYPKWNSNNKIDPIRGEFEEHEVVIYGCNDKGVKILDSHHELYEGRLSKYKNGRYKMDWETLMTVMGFGDLIIPEEFESRWAETEHHELV